MIWCVILPHFAEEKKESLGSKEMKEWQRLLLYAKKNGAKLE